MAGKSAIEYVRINVYGRTPFESNDRPDWNAGVWHIPRHAGRALCGKNLAHTIATTTNADSAQPLCANCLMKKQSESRHEERAHRPK
jgi:hypothetical protein